MVLLMGEYDDLLGVGEYREPTKAEWRARALRAEASLQDARLLGFDLGRIWEVGDRVEQVVRHSPDRPGTVESIRSEIVRIQHLWIRFDDGELRAINPDVMRHRIAHTPECSHKNNGLVCACPREEAP
jgi:hypothetical protein